MNLREVRLHGAAGRVGGDLDSNCKSYRVGVDGVRNIVVQPLGVLVTGERVVWLPHAAVAWGDMIMPEPERLAPLPIADERAPRKPKR
jgi:hypothetical protein